MEGVPRVVRRTVPPHHHIHAACIPPPIDIPSVSVLSRVVRRVYVPTTPVIPVEVSIVPLVSSHVEDGVFNDQASPLQTPLPALLAPEIAPPQIIAPVSPPITVAAIVQSPVTQQPPPIIAPPPTPDVVKKQPTVSKRPPIRPAVKTGDVWFDPDTNTYSFHCPYPDCRGWFQVPTNQINCKIFRHGWLLANTEIPMNPHTPKVECDRLRTQGLIIGCGRPFNFDGHHVRIEEYI